MFRSYDCGCASIGFGDLAHGHDMGVLIFGVDAEIVDESGVSVGGMVLTVRDGRLHDVDVHSWFDVLPFPTIDQVRWHLRTVETG